MLWIISIMGLLVALGALFFTGTTSSKITVFSETISTTFKTEIKTLKDEIERKAGVLEHRVEILERDLKPMVKSHESFGAEIAAIRKQILKLQRTLEGPR